MSQRKRIFNYRPFCFAALFLTLGIITAEAIPSSSSILRLIPLITSLFTAIVLLSIKKARRFAYMAILFMVGVTAMSGQNDVYSARQLYAPSATVQATVASEIIVEDGYTYYKVENVVYNGKKLDGKTYVVTGSTSAPSYGAGDTVEISGDLSSYQHERFDSYYAWSIGKRIYYQMSADSVVKLADGEPTGLLKLQLAVKKLYYYNTDSDTASLCQALILGDKSGMEDDLYDDVKASGLAHVLAVSGLHITALATAVFWLLKKLKLNQKASFLAVAAMTFAYSALCSFTPSSVRAFIMVSVFNFAAAFGLKRDNLSALAFSAVILLLVNPANIMDVGFLLSMFSMLGIFLFYKPISDWLMKGVERISPKRKIGKGAAADCAVSVAANAMTLPFVGYFFGSVPVLFVLSGVIILPYLLFIWLILLIITAFALITTLSGIVGVMDFLLFPVKAWVGFIGEIEWATLPLSLGGVAGVLLIVFWIFTALLISRYVFLTSRQKVCAFSLSAAACLAVLPLLSL